MAHNPESWVKQEHELYAKPKGLEEVDYLNSEAVKFTVEKEGDAAFERILRQQYLIVNGGGERSGNKEKADIYAKGIVYKISKTDERLAAMARRGDTVWIEDGVYSIKSARTGKTYFLKLHPDAVVPQEIQKDGVEMHKMTSKEYDEQKGKVVEKARRQWTDVLEDQSDARLVSAQKRGSVVNFIKAISGGDDSVATLKNRRLIWSRIPDSLRYDDKGNYLTERYQKKGSGKEMKRAQNKAMIAYLAQLARENRIEMLDYVVSGKGLGSEEPVRKPATKEEDIVRSRERLRKSDYKDYPVVLELRTINASSTDDQLRMKKDGSEYLLATINGKYILKPSRFGKLVIYDTTKSSTLDTPVLDFADASHPLELAGVKMEEIGPVILGYESNKKKPYTSRIYVPGNN